MPFGMGDGRADLHFSPASDHHQLGDIAPVASVAWAGGAEGIHVHEIELSRQEAVEGDAGGCRLHLLHKALADMVRKPAGIA